MVAATSGGNMLSFPAQELPELARGKGNKIVQIPPKKLKSGEERLVSVAVIGPANQLLVHSGQRHLRFRYDELERYEGERAKRGALLPRGFRKVDRLEVE